MVDTHTILQGVTTETPGELVHILPVALAILGDPIPEPHPNILIYGNGTNKNPFSTVIHFGPGPIKSPSPYDTDLLQAVNDYNIPKIKELHQHKEISCVTSTLLSHEIIRKIKNPLLGCYIGFKNALRDILNGEGPEDLVEVQVFIEFKRNNQIFFSEQIFSNVDRRIFLGNPVTVLETEPFKQEGIRSADGTGVEFHIQLYGAFAQLV